MSLPTIREFFSGDLSPRQRRIYRLPPAAALGMAAFALAGWGLHSAYQAAEQDKGCVTTKVPLRAGNVIEAALAARGPLGLDADDTKLQEALTLAAGIGHNEAQTVNGGVEPGDAFQSCVTYSPLRFPNRWHAEVDPLPRD